MATTRTVTFEYAHPPSEVAALLQDPVFLRYRSESAGEHNIDVRVENVSDGVRVTVAREKEVDVPAFAKAILGSARRAVETTVWRRDGERWLAQYTIDVGGVPVKAGGKSVLAPTARGGCQYTSTFEITARIPLIGGRIEAFVADGLDEQLRANADRNAEALKRGQNRGTRSFIEGLRDDGSSQASGQG